MGSSSTVAVNRATTRIAIVFAAGADPVDIGLIQSHSRPGGRLTGVYTVTGDLVAKHLQILRELVPKLRRVLAFYNPGNPVSLRAMRAGRDAARQLGITLVEWPVKSADDIRAALSKLTRAAADGYLFVSEPTITSHQDLIVETANTNGLPTITRDRESAVNGALASYGASFKEIGRVAAKPLQRVLAGARPGDIPVEAFDRITLVVNRKTAKRLGLSIPNSIMLRADEVID